MTAFRRLLSFFSSERGSHFPVLHPQRRSKQQLLNLGGLAEMHSLLDEINREYELHASCEPHRRHHHHQHHHQQQQQSSQCHDDVSNRDAINTSSVTSLPDDDEYAAWYEYDWSPVDYSVQRDSTQISFSKLFVAIILIIIKKRFL